MSLSSSSVDPDHMTHSLASDLGLHYLLRAVYLNLWVNTVSLARDRDISVLQEYYGKCPYLFVPTYN